MKKVLAIATTLAMLAATAFAHEHKAPHNGTLVVFGDEFGHIELVLNKKTGMLTAYVLDGEAENPVRLSQAEIQLKLKIRGKTVRLNLGARANQLTGETTGDTSEFSVGTARLKGLDRFSGTVVKLQIKGVSFKNVPFRFPEGNE